MGLRQWALRGALAGDEVARCATMPGGALAAPRPYESYALAPALQGRVD
jgi:hypothetical protein